MRLVQVIDSKDKCEKFYSAGKRYQKIDKIPGNGPVVTWAHSPLLQGQECIYLSLYNKNINLADYCEPGTKEEYLTLETKIKNIIKSYLIAKVDLSRECYSEYIPEDTLLGYLDLKERSMENFFSYNQEPPEYDTLSQIHQLLVKMSEYRNPSMSPGVKYNIYGTKTGRLTTSPGSFPILTLAKENRQAIKSMNGAFVEFDYNAAEIRTMLSLSGLDQPSQDIHAWNLQKLSCTDMSRDEVKKRFFAWLYNNRSEDSLFSGLYDKKSVLQKYWDGSTVKTFFGRSISSDESHALNYILQSTTSDLVLRQAHKVAIALEGTSSQVAFVLHDSVIIDCSPEDSSRVQSLAKIFSQTELGNYRTNIKIGKDFFDMRDVGYV